MDYRDKLRELQRGGFTREQSVQMMRREEEGDLGTGSHDERYIDIMQKFQGGGKIGGKEGQAWAEKTLTKLTKAGLESKKKELQAGLEGQKRGAGNEVLFQKIELIDIELGKRKTTTKKPTGVNQYKKGGIVEDPPKKKKKGDKTVKPASIPEPNLPKGRVKPVPFPKMDLPTGTKPVKLPVFDPNSKPKADDKTVDQKLPDTPKSRAIKWSGAAKLRKLDEKRLSVMKKVLEGQIKGTGLGSRNEEIKYKIKLVERALSKK